MNKSKLFFKKSTFSSHQKLSKDSFLLCGMPYSMAINGTFT